MSLIGQIGVCDQMQATGSSSATAIAGLRGNYMKVAEQPAKPTKQERAASRNELDRYMPMNWSDSEDSRAELNDHNFWVSDASNPAQLQ